MNQFPTSEDDSEVPTPGCFWENSPPEDSQLERFLRQHAPAPPVAASHLEADLIQRIITASPTPQQRWRWYSVWVVSPLMAASLLIAWAGDRWLRPTPASTTEVVRLEAFLETSWDGVVYGGSDF
ncbi:hypothetical protein [Neosynechococcus sphagnicola]|uniref:hypothetical protein n=1 Tax=Neosynechococcus sphagnicola TaxID=1501145 RepID=UPI0006893BA8|nr:hypothetical protein [Neosynechococcus sphagnicola]